MRIALHDTAIKHAKTTSLLTQEHFVHSAQFSIKLKKWVNTPEKAGVYAVFCHDSKFVNHVN